MQSTPKLLIHFRNFPASPNSYPKKERLWVDSLARAARKGYFQRARWTSRARRVRATLTCLEIHGWVSIDATFTSLFSLFSNLTTLFAQPRCADGCAFPLTDQDMVQLSAALPRLETLDLGGPCPLGTCNTTVFCLLALSVHCKNLRRLMIHFNTTNLTNDIQSLSEDPYFRDLGSLPTRCHLMSFDAGGSPFPRPTSDEDITTIAAGLIGIFPSLIDVHSYIGKNWTVLRSRVRKLRGLPP